MPVPQLGWSAPEGIAPVLRQTFTSSASILGTFLLSNLQGFLPNTPQDPSDWWDRDETMR